MRADFVIFDMDGTLVQSEDCASQALIDIMNRETFTVEQFTDRYRGMRLARIFDDVEKHFPGAVPQDALDRYRAQEEKLSSALITATPGANDVLSALQMPKCIASNAPVEKTRRSLAICQLSQHFADNIYSAEQVQAWKPDPALFLHAACQHGMAPHQCLVVEDSEVGVQAALSAGMQVVRYDAQHTPGASSDHIVTVSSLPRLLTLLG